MILIYGNFFKKRKIEKKKKLPSSFGELGKVETEYETQ